MNKDIEIKQDRKKMPKRMSCGSDEPTPEERATENNEQEVTENEETHNS